MTHRLSKTLDNITNQEAIIMNAQSTTPNEWAQQCLQGEEEWRLISLPDIADGYYVSDQGAVVSPSSTMLQPSVAGVQLWVRLKRSDQPNRSRAVRLDKLVLTQFVGAAPSDKDIPVHLDGDTHNCALENLAWGAPGDQARLVPVPDIKRVGLDDMDLSVRTYNVLRRNDILDADTLATYTADDLLDLRGVRQETVDEIEAKGLKLKRSKKKAAPIGGTDEVEVLRVYRCNGVSVTVKNDGTVVLPKINYDTRSARALSKIMDRIEEMNRLMSH